jgi:hypothetical protein
VIARRSEKALTSATKNIEIAEEVLKKVFHAEPFIRKCLSLRHAPGRARTANLQFRRLQAEV